MSTDTFKLENGQELHLRLPNLKDFRESQKVYNSTFKDSIESGAFLRIKLDDFAKEQGIWNDEKQAKFDAIREEVLEKERIIDAGGIKASQARDIALSMIDLRNNMRDLISARTSLDNKTAEGQADNAKFNYLVSVCLVYKDNNKPYFSSLDDFLNRQVEEAAEWGSNKLSSFLYGVDNNYQNSLPEFKFLKEFGFVDDKLRLINKDGHLVDRKGHLIDEYGRFVDKDGKFIDEDGNPVTDDGRFVVEKKPFLDDEGNPIVKEETSTTPAPVKIETTVPPTVPSA